MITYASCHFVFEPSLCYLPVRSDRVVGSVLFCRALQRLVFSFSLSLCSDSVSYSRNCPQNISLVIVLSNQMSFRLNKHRLISLFSSVCAFISPAAHPPPTHMHTHFSPSSSFHSCRKPLRAPLAAGCGSAHPWPASGTPVGKPRSTSRPRPRPPPPPGTGTSGATTAGGRASWGGRSPTRSPEGGPRPSRGPPGVTRSPTPQAVPAEIRKEPPGLRKRGLPPPPPPPHLLRRHPPRPRPRPAAPS